MYSRNSPQVGLSDLGDDFGGGSGRPRRLEFDSDSSSSTVADLSSSAPESTPASRGVTGSGPVPPVAPQKNKFRQPIIEEDGENGQTETIHVMNSVCTRQEAEQVEEMYRDLVQISKDFEVWVLPPEARKNSFL